MTTETWTEPPGGYLETEQIGDPLPRSKPVPSRSQQESTPANGPAANTDVERSVDLASLLDQIEAFLRRFIVFANDHQAVAVALWVAHTHAIDAADTTPYLNVHSPTKRAGKSTLLDILEPVVRHPLAVANMTEAALFRSIQRYRPTLLFDEVDAVFAARSGTDALRGLLNAGHRRGRKAVRMGGVRMTELQTFETFCAKVLAGIGRLPDTITDRSIPIALPRKKRSERVDRNRYRLVQVTAEPLRTALEAWADADTIERLSRAEPAIPDINDRAADGWEPLLVIADEAGRAWPARARAAAVALSGGTEVDDSLRTRLLADIRRVFEDTGADRLPTASIVEALVDIEDAPWAEKWARALRDDPSHKAVGSGLARLLRDFDIKPVKIRFAEAVANGYVRATFEDAWGRYVFDESVPTPTQERNNGTSQVGSPPESEHEQPELTNESIADQACSVVPSLWDEGRDTASLGYDAVGAAALIVEQRTRGFSEETIAVLLNTSHIPPPPGFKGWTGHAVRTAEGKR